MAKNSASSPAVLSSERPSAPCANPHSAVEGMAEASVDATATSAVAAAAASVQRGG